MRIAILDLGTNTFHLLIADVNDKRETKKIFKSKRSVKLGEGAIHKLRIGTIPYDRGLKTMRDYAQIIQCNKVDKVFGFATSAIRSATNGKKFIKEIFRETGIRIKIISGEREAELIYFGVKQCVQMSDSPSLIMDIGGGSTEFIIANDKKIFWKHSFNIGAARLLETIKPSDPILPGEINVLKKYLDKILMPLDEAVKKIPVKQLIGSSGSFDTLAEMIGWKFHRKNVIKGIKSYNFNLDEYFRLHTILLASTTRQRMKMKGLVKMRVDMIVLSTICTHYVIRKFNFKEMLLSKYALKEGALWEAVSGMSVSGSPKF